MRCTISTSPNLTIISEPQILYCETLSFKGKSDAADSDTRFGPPNVSICSGRNGSFLQNDIAIEGSVL